MDALVVLLTLYIVALLLKRAARLTGEPAQVCVATGLLLLPMLLVAWFASDGRPLAVLNTSSASDDGTGWWWRTIADAQGQPVRLNLLAAATWLTLLYIVVTSGVWAAATVAVRRGRTPWLSIHKALVKWPVVVVAGLILLKIDLGTILLGTSVAVIGIGFMLRETLENLFTGITLELEGTVRQGDWIQVGTSGQIGRVYEKTWRAAKLETLNNEAITIPNRVLAAEQIKNFDRPRRGHARVLRIGASYEDPPVKVKDVLRTILIREPDVLPDPQPLVRTVAYEDFAIAYELKFWILDYRRRSEIEDRILTRVFYEFRFHGIQIPFPIRTLHLKQQPEREQEASQAAAALQARTRFLAELPLLAPASADAIDFLAQNAHERSFGPAEAVIHKGESGDALYLVMEGSCEARLPGRAVQLEPGRYFGEMGLLAGGPRTVDVVAGVAGARVLRLDRGSMGMLFARHPELRDVLDATGRTRRQELDAAPAPPPSPRPPLLARLRRGATEYLLPW